jgi:hypothetical protein
MSGVAKLSAFAALLAALFAVGALAGGVIDPSAPGGDAEASPHEEDGEMSGGHAEDDVTGLGVAENGLRVVVEDPELRRGATETVRFRIVDAQGRPVRDFDVEHTKRMHLIVTRRDLTGFQHLHPEMEADGTWAASITLPEAGSYRLFADFTRDGTKTTLASDLRVDGPADLAPLPPPSTTATSDGGYDVQLDAHDSDLRFTITHNGEPVAVEPYLGADGHLVALRDGDLAYLHVHPEEQAAPNEVAFGATFPTAGRYRLFLQFQHQGRVQTVAFTHEVTG